MISVSVYSLLFWRSYISSVTLLVVSISTTFSLKHKSILQAGETQPNLLHLLQQLIRRSYFTEKLLMLICLNYATLIKTVGFEVLTAVSTKMAVFWVVARCIALLMEAARTCETLVNFYQTTRRYNPEDSHLPN
jgi:hypothetical protein